MYRFSKISNSIYIIPHWVVGALKRHGLATADILNYSKLKPILSMNDLLSIEAAQSFYEHILGVRESQSILYEWISTANDQDKVLIETQLGPLSKDKFQQDTVFDRLFTDIESLGDATPFEVVPLSNLAIGVIVYPGHFTAAKARDHHLAVCRAILKQLYVYEKHASVAASPLTLRYLELLSLT